LQSRDREGRFPEGGAMSEHDKQALDFAATTYAPSTRSNLPNANHSAADDSQTGASGDPMPARDVSGAKPQPSNAPPDPFDPMSLGISTEYAAAINEQTSTKPEGRRPNEQEYFRVSPLPEHRLPVASIADKQDNGKVYIISGPILDAVKAEFPRLVRAVLIVTAQTLIGTILAWPVPLAEDRGGKWNSQQRVASEQGKMMWTNMASNHSRAQYDISTVDNPKEVDWKSFPPFAEILRQAFSERLIDSIDHPLLKKLRGKIE
jgi:hypothetical protein